MSLPHDPHDPHKTNPVQTPPKAPASVSNASGTHVTHPPSGAPTTDSPEAPTHPSTNSPSGVHTAPPIFHPDPSDSSSSSTPAAHPLVHTNPPTSSSSSVPSASPSAPPLAPPPPGPPKSSGKASTTPNRAPSEDDFKKASAARGTRQVPLEVQRPMSTEFDTATNPGFEWITYESKFNHPQFRHTDCRVPMGSYSLTLSKARIILTGDVPEAVLTELREAFFPTLKDNATLRACCYRPWDHGHSQTVEEKAEAEGYAVMPYNALKNRYTSTALGTRPGPEASDIVKLVPEWPMWQTASRSSVVGLIATKLWPKDAIKPLSIHDDSVVGQASKEIGVLAWDFGNLRDCRALSSTTVPTSLGPPFSVAQIQNSHFSVKTGVAVVGSVDQSLAGEAGKGCLEKDAISAALRTEYIALLDHFLGRGGSPSSSNSSMPPSHRLVDSIIILPESLTVTCIDPHIFGTGDGFQLRDITRLGTTQKYFPALSIPYVGKGGTWASPVDFINLAPAFSGLAGSTGSSSSATSTSSTLVSTANIWVTYWKDIFAVRIGQAKAILHLCYGLQPLTPNAQNFLLEFETAGSTIKPTGRVVARDLLDMKLHSDWVRTILGHPSDHNTSISLSRVKFTGGSPQLNDLLTWEAAQPSVYAGQSTLIADGETFADKKDVEDKTDLSGNDVKGRVQYFKGTQLNWFPYTALLNGLQVASAGTLSSGLPDPHMKGWQEILFVNTMWGLEHAVAYVGVFNDALALKIDPKELLALPLIFDNPDKRQSSRNAKFISKKGDALVEATVLEDTDNTSAPFLFSENAQSILSLPDSAAGYARAGELHQLFAQWERRVSVIVHEALYGKVGSDGRTSGGCVKELRAFHGLK